MKRINSLIKKSFVALAFLSNSLAYCQKNPQQIEIKDNKYSIINDFQDSLIKETYYDLDKNGVFDLYEKIKCQKKGLLKNSEAHLIQDKNVLEQYEKLSKGIHYKNCKKGYFDNLNSRLKLSEEDNSKSKIQAIDNNKDGIIEEYLKIIESNKNIFSYNYIDEKNNKSFNLLKLTEYDKKTNKIFSQEYQIESEIPLEFKNIKAGEIIGNHNLPKIRPIKIETWDNNQDEKYDEYFYWIENPDKIIEMDFKDLDFDGVFDNFMGFVYDKKTNSISLDLPKEYEEYFNEAINLKLKKGTNLFYCDKKYFKRDLRHYIREN